MTKLDDFVLTDLKRERIDELHDLRQIDKYWMAAVDNMIQHTWEDELRTFFTDPASVRNIMRSTSSVVSGSVALKFLTKGWINRCLTGNKATGSRPLL